MVMQSAARPLFEAPSFASAGREPGAAPPPTQPGQGQGGADIISLLQALDVRIAAGLSGLRPDASARDPLDQARQLISKTLRRAEVAALPSQTEPANASEPQALRYGGLPPRKARRLAEYVELRLAERISVDELAGVAGLSRSYFCRAFRETFHVSPRRYVEARRIEQSQRLMVETDLSLVQIALTCGFGEAAHFSKTYRAVVGISPSRWRRAHRD